MDCGGGFVDCTEDPFNTDKRRPAEDSAIGKGSPGLIFVRRRLSGEPP